jgi:RHS repeat-associated protein
MANTKGTSVISNPQGGGAQSGLGEKFSPDLFTGTGNFSVPIAVPPGRNGFQPELTLGYSSGNGNGVFGMGWALGVPGVSRKTSKGIPVYDDRTDIFILSGAEDLVPVDYTQQTVSGIGWEQTTYRPRTEGLFARIIRHKKTNGEHYWEVRSKDGLISWYGTPGASGASTPGGDPAVTANPENRNAIFSWHLTKTEDPFGNVILYDYTRELVLPSGASGSNPHSYDQLYLSKIRYAQYPDGPNTKYLCEVRFNYEERPDPFSAYKQGFETRITKRCTTVETYTNAAALIKTKTYHFKYDATLPLNGASMLKSVEVEGHPSTGSGEPSEWMPPLEFTFSVFDPAKRELQEINGPLPPNALSEPGFELVDLDGNGLPDLLQLNGTARYWTNKGNGKFSPPRNMDIAPSVQLGQPGVQFIDANGDGRTDLLVNNGSLAGYFPGAFHKVWDDQSFRPYRQLPAFSFADPEVQLIDLDGDGITDVLRNGAKFECFYNDPEKGFYKVRTADKTFANFSFADPRIRFADMTGDGMQDIVLISSGRVQYWPNMGYGRFGNKVNMSNAPLFPEQYDPAQVLLGDLDGDGQADIAFVENNSVTLYVNRSGNGFSAPVKIRNTPRVSNPKALRIIDLLGTGQAGILWSFGPDAFTAGKMYFLDLTKGNKPYVLEQMNNNMGSLTRVAYGSSVYHYLRDEAQPATRWKTDLPFAVQVVNKVEVHDMLSGGKLVTEYNYHNGYWDGMEREFRGFAHVDTVDTESFIQFNVPAQETYVTSGEVEKQYVQAPVEALHYSPPVQTKSWFYVGPVGDSFSRWHEPDFSDEYWSGDTNVLQRPNDMLTLLAELPRRARRDALRTLRGTLLRSELYALDNSVLQNRPYTVTESMMSLREEFNPSLLANPLWNDANAYWSGGGYIFFPFNTAQRTTQYERGTDPMHNFSFTKSYDLYGQAKGQLSIGVPRGAAPLGGGNGTYLATYGDGDYIYKNITGGQYMVNRVKRSISYDATKSAMNTSVFALRDEIFANYAALPVIGCSISYYDGAAFTGLSYGQIGNYGAQVRSETLVITDAIITEAYGSAIPECFKSSPDWSPTNGYPAAFSGQLQNTDERLGYKDKRSASAEFVPGWYAESARVKYDFHTNPSTAVGLMLESRDVFDAWSSIVYDAYLMMPLASSQYLKLYPDNSLSLDTTADYDYRVMQPYRVTDANNNRMVFDFSPLGLLRATAVIGKSEDTIPVMEGDYKGGPGTGFYDLYEPSARMEYDFFAFRNSGDPVWVKTISREQHYAVDPLNNATIEKVEYSDGFGRLLQTRVQAEDVLFGPANASGTSFGSSGLPASQSAPNAPAIGTERAPTDPLNVVVSGWKIYNNKGKVVEQYEPFFDKGFDYLLPGTDGQKIKMFYDPLGRVVKTVNPDNSQQWAIYGIPDSLDGVSSSAVENGTGVNPTPWINYAYDANDLADITNVPNNNVNPSHYFTPKSSETDALGRTIKTTEFFDNSDYANTIDMSYSYDIRGNLLLVKDPYYRNVFEHVYDLRTPQKGEDGKQQPLPPLWTKHIDKGISIILFDAVGKPIESTDAKGARALSGFDVISRPKYVWVRDNSGETTTLRQCLVYGDDEFFSVTDPEDFNLKGKAYKHYDEAGLVTTPSYDFKNNLLEKQQEVILDSELLSIFIGSGPYTCYRVDWTGVPGSPPSITGVPYQTDMEYDALNRVTKMTYPLDLDGLPRKELVPVYNRAGALESASLSGTTYIEHIAYNAKGQRLMIAYGNGIMTRYGYDSLTFRVTRQRSESYTQSTWTFTGAGNVKQDTAYEYDLMANITESHEQTTGCGIGGTNSLDRDFDYDAIYRVLSATGRENAPTITPIWDDSYRSTNDTLTTSYTQNYAYDKLGNIQTLQHIGTGNFTRNFNYTATNNQLQSVDIGATNYAFTYDTCGNQLTETSSRRWEWDATDKPRCFYVDASGSITQYTQYVYDSGGKRVKKLTWKTGGLYDSISYLDGIFEYRTDGTDEQNLLHIMDNRSRIAMIRIGDNFGDSTPAIQYNLEDNLGGSIILLENNGANINKEEYYPFGETSFGSYAEKRYKYCAKERDKESGLYYYGARHYSSWTCRFVSVDPLAAKYNQLTPYNYAGDNPINDKDIDGMQSEKTPTGGDTSGSITYGPETKQASINTPSLPQINGVSGPWSHEFIEKNSPHIQLNEVVVSPYPDFAYPVDDIDERIAKAGIDNFAPKLNIPPGITGGMQKEFAEWNYNNSIKNWNSLSLEDKWMEARKQIGFGALHEVAAKAMEPALEAYKLYAEMGGFGSPTGAAGKITKAIETLDFTLKDLNSFKGAKSADIIKWLEQNGWTGVKTNPNRVYNDGMRFTSGVKGEQIRIMSGGPTRSIPAKTGPYMEASIKGKKTVIPLFGNPTLK